MSETTHKHHKYSLLVYLLIANGITWLGWIPGLIIGARQGYIMPNFDTYAELFKSGFANSQHIFLGVAFQLAVYGPLIGGLVATWMDSGKEGLIDLWQRITYWNIGGRWYLTALGITTLLAGLPVAIFALTGGFASSTYTIAYVIFVFIVQLFTSGFGEEPGWRGFLLPRLLARFAGEKAVWMLGLIWAIWHYPLVAIRTLSMMHDVNVPQMVITIIVSLAGQTMALIGIAFIYVWLYNKTQSVFLTIVFHALSNTLGIWLTSFLSEPQAATLFIALMPWAVVIFMQKRLGKQNFPGILTEKAG